MLVDQLTNYIASHHISLKDKMALITGASAGIGEATAYLLAKEGAHLILVARREDKLQACKSNINQIFPNVNVTLCVSDISTPEGIQAIEDLDGFKVDILINNAGLALGMNPIEKGDEEHWQCVINTNVTAAFRIAKRCTMHMINQNYGHIINITSIAAHHTYDNGGVYAATKHALRAFSRCLRSETCTYPIRVTEIAPGMVETEFSIVRFLGDVERAKKFYEGLTPLSGWDIAHQVIHALKQPLHVNIDEIYLTPQAQGAMTKIARR